MGVTGFDYQHQAWVKDGLYIRCGHPESMPCGCYGRSHEGEGISPQVAVAIESRNQEYSRFADPAYQQTERRVTAAERRSRIDAGYRD